jgi:Outer membrane efflux protein
LPWFPRARKLRPHPPIARGIRPPKGQVVSDGKRLRQPVFLIEPGKTYSLAELIDLAEAHNPETLVAWERARAQAAALGIARSELYPALSAVALASLDREEVPFGAQFYRQTLPAFEASLELNYTIFDFGARTWRIGSKASRRKWSAHPRFPPRSWSRRHTSAAQKRRNDFPRYAFSRSLP